MAMTAPSSFRHLPFDIFPSSSMTWTIVLHKNPESLYIADLESIWVHFQTMSSVPPSELPIPQQQKQQQVVVRVGVGVIVKDPLQPTKIFCGTRKGSHGAGLLALPGGHLELYESWETCARREVLEECDLILAQDDDHVDGNGSSSNDDGRRPGRRGGGVTFAHVTNDPMPTEGKHYVTIFMMAECSSCSSSTTTQPQQPKTMEPDKCEGWDSYSWEELQILSTQGQLFGPLKRLVDDSPTKVMEFLKA